ncbi:hypothetical protein D9757_006724 [Collybiopsis confluens]|uniref:Hydrophobin n=1 Tax=Collybiopsis confluens TaxID=2823264 RepID=A0A8H5HLF0_9AGAR|nr:hypothetical protein D9757_006724 [Collybiopsis confluens]
MQFKAAFVTAAIATLVAASPARRATCSTGPVQCCNHVEKASNPAVGLLATLVGVLIQDTNVDVGLQCSPVGGIGSGGCKSQSVCCENNSSSLISIGCVPIQL